MSGVARQKGAGRGDRIMRAGLKNRRRDGRMGALRGPWPCTVLSFSDGMAMPMPMACSSSTAQRCSAVAAAWASIQRSLIITLIITMGGAGDVVAARHLHQKAGRCRRKLLPPCSHRHRSPPADVRIFLESVLFLSQVLPSTTCSRTSFFSLLFLWGIPDVPL